MKEQLKPCPFCGGEPILNHIEPHTHFMQFNGEPLMPDYPGSWTIECCDVGMIKDTREEVETAWNSREPSAQVEQAAPEQIGSALHAIPIAQAAPVTVPNGLLERIEAARRRIESGHSPRRIPADPTDVDLVLAEVAMLLKGKYKPPFWLAAAPAVPSADAQDAKRYRILRDSKYQLMEDDPCVTDATFDTFFGEDLDKAVDALEARYAALSAQKEGE